MSKGIEYINRINFDLLPDPQRVMNVKVRPATPTEEQEIAFKAAIKESQNNPNQVIWSKERPKQKHSFDWMIFLMCLGFAISFILGYLACLIRSL